jgi:hypothetical protein
MFIACFIAFPPVKFLLVSVIVYTFICFTKLFLNFKPLEEQLGTHSQDTFPTHVKVSHDFFTMVITKERDVCLSRHVFYCET